MFESTQKWRFGEDDFPFQLGDFQVNQPFIFGCVVQPITSNRKKHVVFFVANHETSGHDELKVEDKEDDTNDVIGVLEKPRFWDPRFYYRGKLLGLTPQVIYHIWFLEPKCVFEWSLFLPCFGGLKAVQQQENKHKKWWMNLGSTPKD